LIKMIRQRRPFHAGGHVPNPDGSSSRHCRQLFAVCAKDQRAFRLLGITKSSKPASARNLKSVQAVCAGANGLDTFEVPGGRRLRRLRDSEQAEGPLIFSADGKQLAAVTGGRAVGIWDVATGMKRATLPNHFNE